MNTEEILMEIKDHLSWLNESQKMSLGLAIAERMLPTYRFFVENYEFGNYEWLGECLEKMKTGEIQGELAELEENLVQFCPDLDDFPSNLWATAALDSVGVIHELLQMYQDQDATHLETIVDIMLSIPYMCVSDSQENSFMFSELQIVRTWIEQIESNKMIELPDNQWLTQIQMAA